MKNCDQPCELACPVQKYLRGEVVDQLGLHDGSAAEEIAASTPHAAEAIQEACEPGAPGKPFLGFGRLVCQSALINNHFKGAEDPLHGAESALRMMYLP